MASPWPCRDPATGKQRRASKAELREADRLPAKHRDIASGAVGGDLPEIPEESLAFIAGLGVNIRSLREAIAKDQAG